MLFRSSGTPDKAIPYDWSLSCGPALRMTVLVHDLYGPDVTYNMDQSAAMVTRLRVTVLVYGEVTSFAPAITFQCCHARRFLEPGFDEAYIERTIVH